MTCIGCQNTKSVLNCLTNLNIGTLANSSSYYVYFKNSSSGKLNRVSGTTNGSGLLTIALDFTPLANSTYEVWVVLQASENIYEKETILIDDIESECLYVTFQRVYNSSNASITATTQKLTLA